MRWVGVPKEDARDRVRRKQLICFSEMEKLKERRRKKEKYTVFKMNR